jgi:transposase-like protein
MATEWTPELKEEVIAAYEKADPTPETSAQIVADLADEFEKTPNGIRRILSVAGVYITAAKKPSASAPKDKKAASDKPARVSKEDSIAALVATLESLSLEVDDSIVSKLTGKAAVYFNTLFEQVKSNG